MLPALLSLLVTLPVGEDVEAIHERARAAVAAKDFDAALADYLWLWNESLAQDPTFAPVRTSYVASEMGDLADRHEPARAAFLPLVDALGATVAEGAGTAKWRDWVRLANALDRQDDVLAWVREHRDEQGALRIAAEPGPGSVPSADIAHELFDVLVDQQLRAEAGRLVDLGELAEIDLRTLRTLRQMQVVPEQVMTLTCARTRSSIARLYGAALAAERSGQAASLADTLLTELDDAASRVALVRAALDAGVVGPEQERWLAEAETAASADPASTADAEQLRQSVGHLQVELRRALDPQAAAAEPLPRHLAFTLIPFAEALERTTQDGSLLLIDFTAEWCGPCKRMDKTTWPDAEVQGWIDARGLAVQVDVDRHNDVQRAYKVSAMPTVVALQAGQEIGRFVGYRTAGGLLKWLQGLPLPAAGSPRPASP